MSKQVNRYLKDKTFDRIDHALGRPVDPMADTYREYFATDKSGDLADEFRQSLYWVEGKSCGDMGFFYVTRAGRAALAAHLREIKDPHRSYSVKYDAGHAIGDIHVIATSHSKAKAAAYYEISDCFTDLTMGEFFKSVKSVRLSA